MANGEIYEKNLSNASGIGSGDYLRTVNSNNESEKINYTVLAKAIIEEFTGSSLAGASRSIKTAVDMLYDRANDRELNTPPNDDFDSVPKTSLHIMFHRWRPATLNSPYKASVAPDSGMVISYFGSANYGVQIGFGSNQSTICFRNLGAGTWGSWVRLFTRAELDALNTATTGSGELATQSSWTMLAYSYVRLAKMAFVKIEATSTSTSTSWVTVATGYPAPQRNYYCQIATPQGVCKARLNTSGELAISNSQGINGCKIDTTFAYPLV